MSLEAANLTVTAQAGMRLGDLQAALAEVGQWWPVLPPGGAEATLGGIVATGVSGPYAARYGRVQDLITGVQLALPSGERLKFGIPCVKNVAGLALERLVVGSRGTLCALLEVTLRTLPLPERTRSMVVTGAPSERDALRARLLAYGTRPAAVEAEGESLLVAVQGLEAEVAALEQKLADLASELGVTLAEAPEPEAEIWSRIATRSFEKVAPAPPESEVLAQRLKELFDPRGILPSLTF